jgi:DNA modification methylase
MKKKIGNLGGLEDGKDRVVVDTITTLHNEFQKGYSRTLEVAVQIGTLLYDKRKELKHGQWLPWAKKNLPFSDRTARNYIQIFQHADRLKLEKVSNIYGTLATLKDADNRDRTQNREETRQYRKAFADLQLPYDNPPQGTYENSIIAGDNCSVMEEMLANGMAGKYDAIITSPPYNASFFYSSDYNDQMEFGDYLEELLKPFQYYPKLLRKGGRVIYVIGNYVPNPHRDKDGDYNYDIPFEIRKRVESVAPELRHFGNVIWNKGPRGKCPTNNSFGTYMSPEQPVPRSCYEQIMVYSNQEFALTNSNGKKGDILKEEFQEYAWSMWDVAPYAQPNNPHPCSFSQQLVERILKFWTYPDSMILDCYNGAGVTCIRNI